MEKRNIVKLLALLVLFTVALCGVAFADATPTTVPCMVKDCKGTVTSVVTEPTCKAEGFTTHTCGTCKAVWTTDVTEKLDHTPGKLVEELKATCTHKGFVTYECAVCEEEFTIESAKLSATGEHNWVWSAHTDLTEECETCSKAPTCDADLIGFYTCATEGCGETKHDVVPNQRIPHVYVLVEVDNGATCVKAGEVTTRYMCETCGNPDPDRPNADVVNEKYSHEKKFAKLLGLTYNEETGKFGNTVETEKGETRLIYNPGEKGAWTEDGKKFSSHYKDADETAYSYTLKIVEPVCGTTDGTATITCSLCGYSLTAYIPHEEHKWNNCDFADENWFTKDFDCTKGYTDVYVCGNPKRDLESAAPASFEYDEDLYRVYGLYMDKTTGKVLVEEGTGCGAIEKDHVAGCKEHDFVEYYVQKDFGTFDATELADCLPYTVYEICACGFEAVEDEDGNVTGYEAHCGCWSDEGDMWTPLDPEYHRHCWVNGTKTEMPAKDTSDKAHEWEEEPRAVEPATCTEDGYEIYVCSVCEGYKTVTLDAGHKWAKTGEITTPASCEEEGVLTFKCTVKGCKATKTEPIPAYNHEKTTTSGSKKATCTKDGLDKVTCLICEKVLKEEVIPAAHTYDLSEYSYTLVPTCTTDGKITYNCEKCGEKVEGQIVPAFNHKFTKDNAIVDDQIGKSAYTEPVKTAATCDKKAYTTSTCVLCNDKKVVELEDKQPDHTAPKDEKAIVVKIAPTCTEKGLIAFNCTECGKVVEAETKANGHSFVTVYDIQKVAFVTYCEVCDYSNAIEEVDPEYEITLKGKNGTITLKENARPLHHDHGEAYIRVSVGYELPNGVSYAVVSVVRVEWQDWGWRTTGTFTIPTIQGAGTCTGINLMVVTNENADELTLGAALAESYGMATVK